MSSVCSSAFRPFLLLVNVQCDVHAQLKETEDNYDCMIMTVITLLLFYFVFTRYNTHHFYITANWYIVRSSPTSAIG
jgi:hypothetical protein